MRIESEIYCFRIPLERAPNATIQADQTTIDLPAKDSAISLSLRASEADGVPIKDAKRWALVGEGYPSEDAALRAGTELQSITLISLASIRVGVDTGERRPRGFITQHGLKAVTEASGRQAINDVPGVTAFAQTEPRPVFVSMTAKGVRGASIPSFLGAFAKAAATPRILSSKEQVALFLFNSSFFQPLGEGRLLLLVMAIEALIDPAERSGAAREYVNDFLDRVDKSPLSDAERESMKGALRWLRNESISQAGKRLARERLADRTYLGRSAPDFFAHVYDLRSRIVHGAIQFPTLEEMSKVLGALEIFVSDLIVAG